MPGTPRRKWSKLPLLHSCPRGVRKSTLHGPWQNRNHDKARLSAQQDFVWPSRRAGREYPCNPRRPWSFFEWMKTQPQISGMPPAKKIIFVTGTDTGVGKTVLTALLLRHLRETGCHALAMKPFCSGSRGDAQLLCELQENLLTLDEINPFYFTDPVAPLASRGGPKNIRIDAVLAKIDAIFCRCDVLLVEGIGGLMVPLAKNLSVLDLIQRLGCPVVLVSADKLGTLNHTLMSIKCLQDVGAKMVKVAMMEAPKPEFSSRSNAKIIKKMAPKTPIFRVPNLHFQTPTAAKIKKYAKYLKKTLARILKDDSFITVERGNPQKRLFNKTR